MRPTIILPALVLLAACSGSGAKHVKLATATIDTLPGGIISVTSAGPTRWADTSSGWHLKETARVGGVDTGDVELIEPQSIALDDAGRLYVADAKPAVIKVIGRDGKLIRTIGREGEGPGEFRTAFIAVHGANLVVHDPQISRTSVFDTSGTYLRSWASSCCYWSDIGVDRAGLIYIPTSGQRNDKIRAHYARFRMDGTPVDTIGVPDHGEEGKSWSVTAGSGGNKMMMMTAVPFTPAVRIALNPAGGAIYGWSGDYRLVVSPSGKDTARVFGRDWTASPLADSRKDAAVDAMVANFMDGPNTWDEKVLRKAFDKSDIPGTVPAFESLDIDHDGNIWVRRDNGGDSTVTLLDVFDSTGVYLGPVRLDAKTKAYPAWAWGRDEVAIVEESEDGLPIVVIYGSAAPPVGKDVAAR